MYGTAKKIQYGMQFITLSSFGLQLQELENYSQLTRVTDVP